jgi:hypothetical protein
MRSLRSRRDERPEEQLVSVIHVDPSGYLSVFVVAARMGADVAKPLPAIAPPLPSRAVPDP